MLRWLTAFMNDLTLIVVFKKKGDQMVVSARGCL